MVSICNAKNVVVMVDTSYKGSSNLLHCVLGTYLCYRAVVHTYVCEAFLDCCLFQKL